MRLSIVALALANVAALPVPKAGLLRGAREDEDTSSTHREGGRHVSFGRYAETPTPAPTYWASAVVGDLVFFRRATASSPTHFCSARTPQLGATRLPLS